MLLLCLTLAPQPAVDATQAEAVLELLERSLTTTVPRRDVERVAAMPGTTLVIAQMNVSRRVSVEEYTEVLAQALKGEVAQLRPGRDARAARGVEGLTNDVAPALVWARSHVGELRDALTRAQSFQGFSEAVSTAAKLLPRPVAIDSKLYFVMGGRAGAAASGDGIYIDLLSMTWRSPDHRAQLAHAQMVDFFAHEAHHIGYGKILDEAARRLTFNDRERRVWSFLAGVMLEGAATLLIDARGNRTKLEEIEHMKPDLQRLPALLVAMQSHLLLCLDPGSTDEDVARSQAQFTGQSLHTLGAALLAPVLVEKGLDRVKELMLEPRRLLLEVNDSEDAVFHFDSALATRVSRIG